MQLELAFRRKPEQTIFFGIESAKVRKKCTVEIKDSGAICDCTKFKLESSCHHVLDATGDWASVYYPDGAVHTAMPAAKLAANWVGLSSGNGPERGIVNPLEKDVHIYGLVTALTKGVAISDDQIAGDGYLNASRLYEQCNRSFCNDVAIVDSIVRSVTPSEPVLDADFDALIEEDASDDSGEFTPAEIVSEKTEEAESEEDEFDFTIWKTSPIPNPKKFYVKKEIWQQILYCLSYGKNVLLTGPSGSGKSEICYIATKHLGIDLEMFNMGAMSEPRLSLIGATHFDKEKGTWFKESRFVRSVQRHRGAVLLDEITRCVVSAYNILLPLMDRQGYLALDESEDAGIVSKGKRVAFLATANVGMEYTGTEAMDKALQDRFGTVIHMEFPPAASEVAVVVHRTRCNATVAKKLVDIAVKQRELWLSGEFQTAISTRMLIEAGEMIGHGMAFNQACEFAIENQFPEDGRDDSERTQLKHIIQKHHVVSPEPKRKPRADFTEVDHLGKRKKDAWTRTKPAPRGGKRTAKTPF